MRQSGLFDFLSGKKRGKTGKADPYDAPDLTAHRHDPENITLGFESISMVDGHAGTEVVYYAALHEVVVHSYVVRKMGKNISNIERVAVPDNLHTRGEISSYLTENGLPGSYVLRDSRMH